MSEYDSPLPLIDHILDKLFNHEHKRLASIIDEIETSNRMLKKHKPMMFLHAGILYRNSQGSDGPALGCIPTLSLQLNDAMLSFQAEKSKLKEDEAKIKQMLFRLMHPCKTYQDLRDALPECLLLMLPEECQRLPRTNEDGFCLPDDRSRRQYHKVRDRIEFYFATGLIY